MLETANSSKKAYSFSNVTSTEVKAIFEEMTTGRQVKRVDISGGKYRETAAWKDSTGKNNSISLRNYSDSGNLGELTIDLKIQELRGDFAFKLKF